MTEEQYKVLRKEFLDQYDELPKNELGKVKLKDFKMKRFKEFIFLYTCDNPNIRCNTIVSSIGENFMIKGNRYVYSIEIISKKSLFDKFEGQFNNALKYYNSIK